MKRSQLICGLDVGTSKTCMLIAQKIPAGGPEFISSGHVESRGISKGVVINLNEAADTIRRAAAESGKEADIVRMSGGGDHFQGFNSSGAVDIPITGERQEVTRELMLQVIAAAKAAIPLPPEDEIRHVLAQEFFLNGEGGIKNPVGLSGSLLNVNVHIVTCRKSHLQNLINAANRAEMYVSKVIAQPLASAEAVLTKDEKELGVAAIDIGGGSTGIAVYRNSAVHRTTILPVGGNSFTRDLAIGLQTSLEDAEQIKKSLGTVAVRRTEAEDPVTVQGMAREPREVTKETVSEILRARALELMQMIEKQIRTATKGSPLIAGAVITGGGSMLDGITTLAEEILHMPARQGVPGGISGLNNEMIHPQYAAVVGLVLFGTENSSVEQRGKIQRLADKVLSFLNK